MRALVGPEARIPKRAAGRVPAGAIRRATRAAAAVRWRGRRLRRSLSYGFWEHRDGTGIERINQLLLRTTVGVADLLRDFGATVEGGAIVHGPLVVHNASAGYANLAIGRHAHVGRLVVLDLTAPLSIEPEAVVSMGTTILTHADVGERPLAERYPRRVEPTRIGAGSYVGANATILCGCHVGAGAVVGAGSVVTKPVAPGAVVAGVPARSLQGDARVDPPIG